MELGKMDNTGGNQRKLATPPVKCIAPSHLIGVQDESPLDWSPDGSKLLFTSENHSIYVCSFNEAENGNVSDYLAPGRWMGTGEHHCRCLLS